MRFRGLLILTILLFSVFMPLVEAITVNTYILNNHITPNQTVIADFESLTGWTKGSLGTIELDSDNEKVGTYGIRVGSPNSASPCFMTRTVAVDFTNSFIRFWAYIDNVANLGEMRIYLSYDSGFTQYITNNVYQYVTSYPLVTGFNEIVIPFGANIWTKTGAVQTMPEIIASTIRIRLRVTAKASTEVKVTFDDLCMVENQYSGAVSLVFDDHSPTQYSNAYPKLSEYGYKGVIGTITNGSFNGIGEMTLGQISTLYNAGWDITSHGHTHADFKTLSDADLNKDLSYSKQWLTQKGFGNSSLFLAVPYHSYNSNQPAIWDNYYSMTRSRAGAVVGQMSNPSAPLDVNILSCVAVIQSTPLATLKTIIDDCYNYNNWSILLFHHIETVETEDTDYLKADFDELIDYINAKGLRVLTYTDRYEELVNVVKWVTPDRTQYIIDSGVYLYDWAVYEQTAYQIQFDNDIDFSSITYDSGKVVSGATQASLTPPVGEAFYVRVHTWNNADSPSPPSDIIKQFQVFAQISNPSGAFLLLALTIFIPLGLVFYKRR